MDQTLMDVLNFSRFAFICSGISLMASAIALYLVIRPREEKWPEPPPENASKSCNHYLRFCVYADIVVNGATYSNTSSDEKVRLIKMAIETLYRKTGDRLWTNVKH